MSVKIWQGGEGTDVSKPTNWSGAAIPVNGDSIVVPATASSNMKGDLDALAAVTLVGFQIEDGCPIKIGERQGNNIEPLKITLLHSAAYYDAYLGGVGETYLYVNEWADMFIRHAGASPVNGISALNLTGLLTAVAANGQIHVEAPTGTVSLGATKGFFDIESLEFNNLFITGSRVEVRVGMFCQDKDNGAVKLEQKAGTVWFWPENDSVEIAGGLCHLGGRQDAGTANTLVSITGGRCNYITDCAITTLYIANGGVMNFDNDLRAKTVTNCTMGAGGSFIDTLGNVTITNGIDLPLCGIGDVHIDWGTHRTLTPSAI